MLNTGTFAWHSELQSSYSDFHLQLLSCTILFHVLHELAKFTILLSCCHFNIKCHLYINIIPVLQILSQNPLPSQSCQQSGSGNGTWRRQHGEHCARLWIHVLLCTVILVTLLISAVQLPLQNEDNNTYLIEPFWELTEILHVALWISVWHMENLNQFLYNSRHE